MNVRLTREMKVKLLNSEDVYSVMQAVLLRENKIRRNQEHFWVVGLDNKNKILFIELVALGGVNRINSNPPEVFRMAIYKLAVKMILVHNHPSGEVRPISQQDKDFTDHLIKAGQMIRIEVIEHLVISEKEYFSFADEGLIEQLKNNGRFELVDTEKAELQQLRLELERDKAEREKALEIAKKMLAEGDTIEKIKRVTGVTKYDLRK